MESQYLDLKETAAYMHISKSYLYQLSQEKKIPHIKLGRKRLFTTRDVDEFLNSHRIEAVKPVNINYLNYNYSKSEAKMVRNAILRSGERK